VIACFYSRDVDTERHDLRECQFMRRVGFSEEDINQYQKAAREAEALT
jgi:hypothetical protein